MNTTTVKMALKMLVLCLGFFHFTFASHRLRFFDIFDQEKTWTDSSTTCQNTNASLVTLYDEEDANFTERFAKLQPGDSLWLGLYHQNRLLPDDSARLNQTCGAIHNNNLECFNCTERPFKSYQRINITNLNKPWCQALQYCSQNPAGSRRSEAFKIVNNISFLIALDEWEWQDNGCSSFREWMSNSNSAEERCTVLGTNDQSTGYGLKTFGCNNDAQPFCANGTVRIKVIQQELTWEEAYDYCIEHHSRLLWIRDQYDQKAVEQWVNHTGVEGNFWIGLTQSRVFGFWIWTSDTTVGFSNWKDNKMPKLPTSEHCGVFNKEDREWRDFKCSESLPFLCEEDIIYIER